MAALIYSCNSIRRQMNNGQLTGEVYVDLSKIIDNISHSVLLKTFSLME